MRSSVRPAGLSGDGGPQGPIPAAPQPGQAAPPVQGGFRNARCDFCGQEDHDGKAILVRFVISDITPNSVRFEQAYSDDGGRNWETNWIAVDTRIGDAE
ncbi:hypothetical protein [Pseudoxanthomonas beigongshangi]|uniref:hypothetical protein n=1 Tax=Pseudoxanthomonas beigongshangi TaxID=2782537 RepID=UPI00193C6394|nr:hypothetical protein [Pseudoxanthomonas beigongshangi]